jgi:hypothetical protein
MFQLQPAQPLPAPHRKNRPRRNCEVYDGENGNALREVQSSAEEQLVDLAFDARLGLTRARRQVGSSKSD